MTRRTKDWNEGLAEDLRDPAFAKEFIRALIEDEGFSLQEALGKTIRAFGIKEFAVVAEMPESNVIRAIDPSHNPTQKTLLELLKPFKLKISVTDEVA